MNHPPFIASHQYSGKDGFALAGAQRLAAMIRMAWGRCGHDVQVDIVPLQVDGRPAYTVRLPTLINGMPVR